MKKEILKYLKSYSYDTLKINELIVTSFVHSNNISVKENKLIKKYLIKENDKAFKSVIEFIKLYPSINFENLIELFEFVISPAEKIVSGAIYTPLKVREYILNQVVKNIENWDEYKICDPACGCAGFLFTAARKINRLTGKKFKDIFETNLYGIDIQKYSVERSKILLTLLAIIEGEDPKEIEFNLYRGNSLNFNWSKKITKFNGFDLVVGNPPYVCSRNIEDESKELLKNWETCSTGHPDLYIPFFELGFKNLKPNGILGYITMNTFFKSINGRALRSFFETNLVKLSILDFGSLQIFNSKSTYTCICIIQKSKSDFIEYLKAKNLDVISTQQFSHKYDKISYEDLDSSNGWNLQEFQILNKIEKTGHSIGKSYKSRNGIATLKNSIYIFSPVKEDNDYYYLFSDKLFPIEKAICKDIVNPNKLIKTGSLSSLKKKVIFPYKYIKDKVELIANDDFQKSYPHAYSYLLTKKEILKERDKGNGKYKEWYAYGRNQSLEKLKYKLFFPHISPVVPKYIINSDENLLFHNGLAIIGESRKELLFLKKIMSSRIFWFYIVNSSRNYGSNYFSLSKNYFKNFGIYDFSIEEKDYIINENNQSNLDKFIEEKYDINLSIFKT